MAYILDAFAEDTFNASGLAAGATSGTLTTGNFGSPAGTQLLVVDYDVPAKREIISCAIAGTALTSITRALDGTSDVAHSASAKVIMAFVPTHYANGLGIIAAADALTAHSATLGGFSGTPTQANKYVQIGKLVTLNVSVNGTSNATSFTYTLPVAAKYATRYVCLSVSDNSVDLTTTGMIITQAGSTSATIYKDPALGTWTASGSKIATGTFTYEAN